MSHSFLCSHKRLHPHHIYQLEVIFLFFLGFLLFFAYAVMVNTYNLDMTSYQWYFTLPWAVIYSLWCLHIRNKIPPGERISPLKRPVGHWMLLGIALIAYQLEPVNLARYYSVDIPFAVFTLFLADSYWDFI